ncbi:MAG: hypothetical protein IPM51_06985 [Sphingobacteriaceae bacterium]|nr:hypothetical protein [Sphingobacteriaceae bacterium]
MKSLTLTLLLLCNILIRAQDSKNAETVLIRMAESMDATTGISTYKSEIVICKPNLQLEVIELEKVKSNLKTFETNALVLQKEIKKWQDAGFKIFAMSNGGTQVLLVTTVILTKE